MIKIGRRIFFLILISIFLGFQWHEAPGPSKHKDKYHIYKNNKWVDSCLKSMTIEEKIGQLFMVAAWSSKDKMNMPLLRKLIYDYHVGGVIFFKGNPTKQVEMTNELQRITKYPLLVGIDAEWGLAMRLDSTVNFGYQMPMGAIRDDSLIYKMGKEIGQQCKRMGIHVNFAPVVDVNNNPLNPVINLRSFSEDKHIVARKANMYMKGMQDENVLAVAKHFPGHGNTSVDSHLDLPILNQPKEELDTLELFPFRYLFNKGVGGVMTAHLHIPAFDTAFRIGASLSHGVTTDLLRSTMKFKGLVFSDALNMKGVSKYYQPGELELMALLAGNDVLLYSEDVPRAIDAISKSLKEGCINEAMIDEHVRRILQVKYWAGLDECHYIPTKDLVKDLNSDNALLIKQKIAEEAVTIVNNQNSFIPLKRPDTMRIVSIAVGTVSEPMFQTMLRNYTRADFITIPMNSLDLYWGKMLDTLKYYDCAIISMHNLSNRRTATYGMTDAAVNFVLKAEKTIPTILVSFGSPYALSRFPNFKYIIQAYQDEPVYQSAAAQVLMGGLTANGRLPVTSGTYSLHTGYKSTQTLRLPYTIPEETGIKQEELKGIDSIVNFALENKIMPGCQIAVVYKGKVILNKSYGSQTYNNLFPVQNSDIYDIASITKVAATTLIAMKLYEEGKLNIFKKLGDYLPDLEGNKKKIQIKEIMTHQAGLQAWEPYYKKTLDANGYPDSAIYTTFPDSLHTIRVTQTLYLDNRYKDSIFKWMDESKIVGRGKYRYSDFGFIYMAEVIEKITGKTLDVLADSLFYKPMNLATLGYKPYSRFLLSRIMPTEQDNVFRHQLIRGDVHDPSAAMLGGVSGHAGLFSNANDLAILMQMLLDGGEYGNMRFLKPETIKIFTSLQYPHNRRGLGWDKPNNNPEEGSPASQYASDDAFGHTGFTGTCVWADPDYDLVYVFLSNRVYPNAENNLLAKYNIRTNIHDVIYQAVMKAQDKKPKAHKE